MQNSFNEQQPRKVGDEQLQQHSLTPLQIQEFNERLLASLRNLRMSKPTSTDIVQARISNTYHNPTVLPPQDIDINEVPTTTTTTHATAAIVYQNSEHHSRLNQLEATITNIDFRIQDLLQMQRTQQQVHQQDVLQFQDQLQRQQQAHQQDVLQFQDQLQRQQQAHQQDVLRFQDQLQLQCTQQQTFLQDLYTAIHTTKRFNNSNPADQSNSNYVSSTSNNNFTSNKSNSNYVSSTSNNNFTSNNNTYPSNCDSSTSTPNNNYPNNHYAFVVDRAMI
jgi:hypothetical protein